LSEGFIGVGDKACFLCFSLLLLLLLLFIVGFVVLQLCCWFLRGRGAKILLHALSYLGTVHGLTTSRSSANVQSGLSLRASVRELCVLVVVVVVVVSLVRCLQIYFILGLKFS
jgi:hypothetical protein